MRLMFSRITSLGTNVPLWGYTMSSRWFTPPSVVYQTVTGAAMPTREV